MISFLQSYVLDRDDVNVGYIVKKARKCKGKKKHQKFQSDRGMSGGGGWRPQYIRN